MSDKKTPEQMAEEYLVSRLEANIAYEKAHAGRQWPGMYYGQEMREAYLAGYEAARPKWISVTEGPIPADIPLLVKTNKGERVVAEYSAQQNVFRPGCWFVDGRDYTIEAIPLSSPYSFEEIAIEWMPLPEVKEGEK